MSDELERVKRFRRYSVDGITESSTGPMVAVCLYLEEPDQEPYFQKAYPSASGNAI